MAKKAKQPTIDLYTLFCTAFEHFNKRLFGGALPNVIITMQRKNKTMGYFSKNRWADASGQTFHEIAVNPTYFAGHKLIEVLQTIVHEQCHLWQEEFGTPSRRTYHNSEWAHKMESVGLMPSSTGKPGGSRTGQTMSDYPISGGHFLQACTGLLSTGFDLSWIDRYPACLPVDPSTASPSIGMASVQHFSEHGLDEESFQLVQEVDGPQDRVDAVEIGTKLNTVLLDVIPNIVLPDSSEASEVKKKNKVKYTCGCNNNVWGKPDLSLRCEVCKRSFKTAESD